jgi:D-alanyl-D-alanine carboxypeptidase (penicillin-binding protein 5/6)
MKPSQLAAIVLTLSNLLTMGLGPARLTDGDWPQRPLERRQIAALRETPFPDLTAAAVLAVNTTTGRILYARNEHERRSPASLTKIITAIVAVERGDLDRKIIIKKEDLAVYSMIGMQIADEYTLHDLIYILLIPSDNAAAMAIARTLAGGDAKTFVGWMNEKVAEWGLQDTHFTNPHGFDAEGNYTSAYDMALIALRAMHYPWFAEMVGSVQKDVANWRLRSTNQMLSSYPGAVGIKTGTEVLAGECLITLVRRPEGEYLTVVLGSRERYQDSTRLLDYYYGTLSELHIDLPETDQNRYRDANGQWHAFGLRESLVYLVDRRLVGTETLFRQISAVDGLRSADEPVGTLRITLGGQVLEEPLYERR